MLFPNSRGIKAATNLACFIVIATWRQGGQSNSFEIISVWSYKTSKAIHESELKLFSLCLWICAFKLGCA